MENKDYWMLRLAYLASSTVVFATGGHSTDGREWYWNLLILWSAYIVLESFLRFMFWFGDRDARKFLKKMGPTWLAKVSYEGFVKKRKANPNENLIISEEMEMKSIKWIIEVMNYGESAPTDPDVEMMNQYIQMSLWLEDSDYIEMKKLLNQEVKYITLGGKDE